MGFRVPGFRVQGSGSRELGSVGFWVEDSRIHGSFRVLGLGFNTRGFTVRGSWFMGLRIQTGSHGDPEGFNPSGLIVCGSLLIAKSSELWLLRFRLQASHHAHSRGGSLCLFV